MHRETEVTGIDPGAGRVQVRTPTGADTLAYDRLVLATGAHARMPPIPGLGLEGVFPLHHMGDGLRLRAFLESRRPQRAVLLGAGYIGCEMTEALSARGIDVTLVERAASVLPSMHAAMGNRLRDRMASRGVRVLTDTAATGIETTASGLRVETAPGAALFADLVVYAFGAAPDTALAESIGLPIGVGGAIRVDQTLRTEQAGVWAAGDCAETWHRLLTRPTYLPLGTTAHKQGRIAGENAVRDARRRFAGTLGTQVVRVFDTVVGRTGLTREDARKEGYDALSVSSAHPDHKAYIPGASDVFIDVVGDRVTGRLLGAQILGTSPAEIAKRLDIFATALATGLAVEALEDLDLSYTPPLGSPWDPVQGAAQAWCRERDRRRMAPHPPAGQE